MLHALDQRGRPVVTDLQPPLDVARRGLAVAHDDLHRLLIEIGRIDLFADTNVVAVTADESFVTVVIEEKQPFVGTNRLSMVFDPKDFKLRQWTITDVQGYDTTIAVSNLDTNKRPDPNLFRIDYQRMVQ